MGTIPANEQTKQLLEVCRNAYSLLMTAAKSVERNAAGHVQLKATTLVSSTLPSTKHTSFVMACLKAMDAASFVEKDSEGASWWRLNPQAKIDLTSLKAVLQKGEVFISRGQPNDPYKLQVVEVTHAKTAEERLKEENAELKRELAESSETVEKLKEEVGTLKTALREALALAKQVCQIAQRH